MGLGMITRDRKCQRDYYAESDAYLLVVEFVGRGDDTVEVQMEGGLRGFFRGCAAGGSSVGSIARWYSTEDEDYSDARDEDGMEFEGCSGCHIVNKISNVGLMSCDLEFYWGTGYLVKLRN